MKYGILSIMIQSVAQCSFSTVGRLETGEVHDEVQVENQEGLRDERQTRKVGPTIRQMPILSCGDCFGEIKEDSLDSLK